MAGARAKTKQNIRTWKRTCQKMQVLTTAYTLAFTPSPSVSSSSYERLSSHFSSNSGVEVDQQSLSSSISPWNWDLGWDCLLSSVSLAKGLSWYVQEVGTQVLRICFGGELWTAAWVLISFCLPFESWDAHYWGLRQSSSDFVHQSKSSLFPVSNLDKLIS